jgi:hypothetical protein
MRPPRQNKRKDRQRKALAAGLLAALPAWAQAAPPTNEELQQQIEALKAQVQALQQLLSSKVTAAEGRSTEKKDEAVTPGVLAADAAQQPATKADVDGLRGDLENYKYEQQRARETKTATTTRGTTLGGTVQVRASAFDPGTSGGSTASATGRRTSFDIPQVTLNLAGSLYRDYAEGRNLDYRVAFAYAPNSPANNNSQFNLTDAYLHYSPFPTTSGLEEPKLSVRAGQQQIPFGLEAQVGEELRPVINSAQFLSTLGVGTRQIGVFVRGDLAPYVDYGFNYRAPLLEYAVGAFNGSGPNKSDDNGAKDYIARAAFTLPVDYYSVLRELKLGASFIRGTRNLTRTSGSGANASTATVATGASNRAGLDLYYNHDPFGATYEYAEGRDDTLQGATGLATRRVKSKAHVLTLFYTWGEQWVKSYRGQAKYDDWWPKSYQLFVRHDRWDPNTAATGDRSIVNTAGLNLFFAETTKFQLNVARTQFDNPLQQDNTALLLQFQYGF